MCDVHCVVDVSTGTAQYLVVDQATSKAVLIDPVLDYDADAGRTSTSNVVKLLELVATHHADVQCVLETHCHADHMTGAQQLREKLGAHVKLCIGAKIVKVQDTFKALFNMQWMAADGSQWDVLLREGDELRFGQSVLRCLETPGHTSDSMSFDVPGLGVFVGDTLFAPDKGTARTDFPGGDAATLQRSIERLLSYPADTRLFLCHDYPGSDRAFRFETTVAEQRRANIHLQPGTDFVAMRRARDATLKVPHLILPAVQLRLTPVNVNGGAPPPPEANGVSYLKIPLNRLQ